MNFTYDSSGSAQQILWAQNAIAACTYPLANLNINVVFLWVSALPTTVHGLLMLTQPQNDGSYKIFINNRADDPNASHLVGGLDNPPAEIQRFYMESVIHELGHVVHFTLLGSDTGKQDVVCNTLEIPQPLPTNGYRIGDHTDYAQGPPTILWADSVKEGIAEVFKDMTYDQRIYDNRSNWKLRGTDQIVPFGQGMSSATSTTQWFDDFTGYSNLTDKYVEYVGVAPLPVISGGEVVLTIHDGDSAGSAWLETPVQLSTPSVASIRIDDLKISHGSFYQASVLGPISTPASFVHLSLFTFAVSSFGGDVKVCQLVPGIFQICRGALTLPRLPLGFADSPYAAMSYPFWLVMRRALNGDVNGELWQTDPELGGSPVISTSTTPGDTDGVPQGIYFELNGTDAPASGDIGEAIKVTDFRYKAETSAVPWTPGWPYADSQVALGDHNSAILRMKNQIASSKLALTTR